MRPWVFVVSLGIVAAGAAGARADNSETCKKAEALVGKKRAKTMSEGQCQLALDTAEEEQWQLWLDMASADEQSASPEKAIATYQRFVDAADKRGTKLAANWAQVRDDMRGTLAKLDTRLLETKARVTFQTVPVGAEVTFPKGAQGTPEKAPVTKYFEPGQHVARIFDAGSQKSREVTFTCEKGQTLVLKADLLTDAPSGAGIIESEGPAIIGQDGPKGSGKGTTGPDHGTTGGPDGGPNTILEKDLDPETAPIAPPPSMWDRIGAASIGVGIAGLTAGAVFLAQGLSLDDNAACSGDACLFDRPQRARIQEDAKIAKNRAIGGFILGAVFVAGGVTALLLADDDAPTATGPQPKDDKPAKPEKSVLRGVSPWIGSDGGGVGATFAF